MESIKAKKPATCDKLTRAQIAEHVEKERKAAQGNTLSWWSIQNDQIHVHVFYNLCFFTF